MRRVARTLGVAAPVLLASAHAHAQDTTWSPADPSLYAPLSPSGAATAPPPPPEPPRYEPPAPRFGAPGEVVVTATSTAGFSWQKFDRSNAEYLSAVFSPGVDVFVTNDLSIGAEVNLGTSDDKGYSADGSFIETKSTTLSAGPRAGVALSFGRFSVYPRLAIGYESVHRDGRILAPGSQSSPPPTPFGGLPSSAAGAWLSLSVPLLFHVRPHLFVGGGPVVFHEFGDQASSSPYLGGERTNIGCNVSVGGWWGGAIEVDAMRQAEQPAEPPPPHRFGLAHQIVISGEIGAGHYTTYGAGHASTVTLGPAIDYFVVDHVSLGFGFSVSISDSQGNDPLTGLGVNASNSGGGVALRAGADLPLGPWLSFYPRAAVSAGALSTDDRSNQSENQYTEAILSVGVYAPLLVHPASHFFLGFGPSIGRDLVRTVSAGRDEIPSTFAGASMTMGGWVD
jgi:hypothetical protein